MKSLVKKTSDATVNFVKNPIESVNNFTGGLKEFLTDLTRWVSFHS